MVISVKYELIIMFAWSYKKIKKSLDYNIQALFMELKGVCHMPLNNF